MTGPSGPRGVKGEVGANDKDGLTRNWKQCAWQMTDETDFSPIKVNQDRSCDAIQ